jgi:hypothetical protein
VVAGKQGEEERRDQGQNTWAHSNDPFPSARPTF